MRELGRVQCLLGAPGWQAVNDALRGAIGGEQLGAADVWAPLQKGQLDALSDLLTRTPVDLLVNYQPARVPAAVIANARIAVNLHLGPPRWPGRGSCSWALLNNDQTFGVTAHLMTNEIDQGPILLVEEFPIETKDDAESLHAKAIAAVPRLVTRLIERLRKDNWEALPTGQSWERKPMLKRELGDAMRLTLVANGHYLLGPVEREDIRHLYARPHRVFFYTRAFGYTGKPGPYIEIDRETFAYEKGRV